MERRIFKYQLGVSDQQTIVMPKGAEILTAQMQNRQLCLWALVDEENQPEKRIIEIYGTGEPFPEIGISEMKYISTINDDGLMWHIFELKND